MTKSFAFGVFLLITNFIVGKLAIPIAVIDFTWGIAVYIFSWLMLLAGLLLCGREGWIIAKNWYHEHQTALLQSVHLKKRGK